MLSIGVSPKGVIYRGVSPKPCYLRCLSVWGQSGAARTLWGRTVAAREPTTTAGKEERLLRERERGCYRNTGALVTVELRQSQSHEDILRSVRASVSFGCGAGPMRVWHAAAQRFAWKV